MWMQPSSRGPWRTAGSTPLSRWTSSWSSGSAGPTAIGLTPSGAPAWPSTGRPWTRTDRWSSRATPRRFSAPTGSSPPSCPTATGNGRSSPCSSTSWCPSCPRRWKRTCRGASSKPSTWTATGSREEGHHGHRAPRRGRRDRAGAHGWRRAPRGTRTGPPVQHHPGVQ